MIDATSFPFQFWIFLTLITFWHMLFYLLQIFPHITLCISLLSVSFSGPDSVSFPLITSQWLYIIGAYDIIYVPKNGISYSINHYITNPKAPICQVTNVKMIRGPFWYDLVVFKLKMSQILFTFGCRWICEISWIWAIILRTIACWHWFRVFRVSVMDVCDLNEE